MSVSFCIFFANYYSLIIQSFDATSSDNIIESVKSVNGPTCVSSEGAMYGDLVVPDKPPQSYCQQRAIAVMRAK
jgi:hypothetical protein